jgi:predicted dehydrogenase
MNFNAPIRPASKGLAPFMDRRGFLRNTAMAGGSLLLATSKSAVAQQTSTERVMKCALVGCGDQGDRLRDASKDCPGVQWLAVADIWQYNRRIMASHMAYQNKHQVNGKVNEYDTIEEMLDKEKDLDCVFIATPDFLHAPFTRMALEKGKAVYSEKLMSNTLEGAKDMVKAQATTGGILQIGHQRHSNPRYINLREQVYKGAHLLGRVTHAYGQWNRGVSASMPRGVPKGQSIAKELLDKYGYANEYEFRNWRYFRKYGGGIIADLGAHQIDLFNWMFESVPTSIIATGGVDYYDGKEGRPLFELPDNVMCLYEYKLPSGVARAYYQVLTTTGSQGYYEKFMGVDGTAIISESPTYNQVYREPNAPDWSKYSEGANPIIVRAADSVKNKYWEHARSWEKPKPKSYDLGRLAAAVADVRESKALDPYELPTVLSRVPHAPHVQNFIEAARMKKPEHLNCPAQQGLNCAVAVLTSYKSIDSGAKVDFKPDDYKA